MQAKQRGKQVKTFQHYPVGGHEISAFLSYDVYICVTVDVIRSAAHLNPHHQFAVPCPAIAHTTILRGNHAALQQCHRGLGLTIEPSV